MRDKTRLLALIGMSSFGTAAIAGAPTLILDDFDADPNDDAGGPRMVSSEIFTNPFGQIANFDVDTDLDTGGDIGAAVFNAGIGVGQEGRILWDNDGAGLSLDAVSLGLVGFELDFAAVDLDFALTVVLTDGAGDSISAGVNVAAGGSRVESIGLGDFESALFDATDVDAVEIIFNEQGGTASLDFILTEFRAVVPTPGSAALLAMGGLVVARRRR